MTDPPVPQLARALRAGDTHGPMAEQLSPAALPRNPRCQTNLFCPCDPVTQRAGERNARDGKYFDSSEAFDPVSHKPMISALIQPRAQPAEEPQLRAGRHGVSSATGTAMVPQAGTGDQFHPGASKKEQSWERKQQGRSVNQENHPSAGLCSRPGRAGRDTESGTTPRDGQQQSCPTQGRRATHGTQLFSRNSPCHRIIKVQSSG